MAFFYVYAYFLTVAVKIIAYKINQLQKYFIPFVGRIIKYYTIASPNQLKQIKMKNQFDILKNGKNATAVWANPTTKEIYPANRNSFGYNALQAPYDSPFYKKYGCNMKVNAPKVRGNGYSYSARQMESIGFQLVMRGEQPLWS